MNNINDIEKLSLEYLMNPNNFKKYFKNNKEVDKELLNDKIFYRKRIINCIKEMLKGEFENKLLEDNFNIYIKSIIIYLKELDIKEILQEDYKDLSNNKINRENDLYIKYQIENSNSILYKEQKPCNILNKFVNYKCKDCNNYNLPEKKEINLKDPRFKKKGLPKKEKYINNINENKK